MGGEASDLLQADVSIASSFEWENPGMRERCVHW